MVTETLGQRVRRLRLAKGIRFQKDLAKMVGMDPASMNQIEQGYREPKRATVDKLALALGTTREYIYEGERSAARARVHPPAVESAPEIASEPHEKAPPDPVRSRHAEYTEQREYDPDLHALIRASVQAAISDELSDFTTDIVAAVSRVLVSRRPATASRKGARSKAQ